jgi:hypothetical protein
MSMRIHVVGAYGASEAEFRTALDLIGDQGNGSQQFRIGSTGKWMWANASVWHVGGSDIDDALSSLSVPALRVTSSDAVLWMLTLTGAGRDRFHGVHHFTQVGSEPQEPKHREDDHDEDFPDDELEEVAGINKFVPELQFLWDWEEEARLKKEYAEEEAATVVGLDDYTDYGVTLSEAVIEEMKRHPDRAHYTAFMGHGPQIVEALVDFEFELDRASMLQLLTVGPLTDLEEDSDIGNMPRFLRTLGIDGVFREESEADEEPSDDEGPEEEHEDEDVDWTKYPPGKLFEKVEPLLAQCPLTEISGGSVKLTQCALLHLLAHLCAENPTTSVLVEFPSERIQLSRSWENLPELEARQSGAQWHFCFETPSHCWYGVEDREELESHKIAEALGTPPDGTRVEFAFVVEGLAEKCHRYAGTYRKECLEIERAYPRVTAGVLGDALGLVDQVFGSQSIALASEEEENVVRRNYQRSQDEVPKIRNGKIMPEYGSRGGVVQTLLLERLADRGPWDMAGARRLVEADWEWFERIVNPDDDDEEPKHPDEPSEEDSKFTNMLQKMSEAVERFKEAKVVPHSEEVLYEGRTGKFLRASMSDLGHIPQDGLEEHDATLAAFGFRCIGDSVGDADQRQEITRCYSGHPQAVSLLSHRNADNQFGWAEVSHGAMMVDFSEGTMEFHTHFEDGTSLVTTSIDAATSKPEAGIYVRAYEELQVTQLWAKHLDGIDRFKEHRSTVPVDHTKFSELVSFLAVTDELLRRFMGED